MLKIEKLSKNHDRKNFDCGDKKLNEFLQKRARQHADREISRTFVLINDENPTKIFGYYTLTVCEVVPADIPDTRLQQYPHPMPAAKLAPLAVSSDIQKNGFGQNMLLNAMERSLQISDDAGLVGLFVDSKNDAAAEYYIKYGFIPNENNPLVLYLAMASIRQAFEN